MTNVNNNQLQYTLPNNQALPSEGPKAIPLVLDFSGAENTYVLDLLIQVESKQISMIQTIYVDNSGSSTDLTITVNTTGQKIIAVADTQGYYNILCPNPPRLTFKGTANTNKVTVFLINIPIAGMVWAS